MAKLLRTPLALSDSALDAIDNKTLKLTIRALSLKEYEFWQDEDEEGWPIFKNEGSWFRMDPPYGPVGSLLWVRELYRVNEDGEVEYRQVVDPDKTSDKEWKPVIGMPEKYSRFRLKVTGYEFKSLQDITTEEIRGMGFSKGITPRKDFLRYWNKRFRDKLLRWDQNPAVWITHFKVQRRRSAVQAEK